MPRKVLRAGKVGFTFLFVLIVLSAILYSSKHLAHAEEVVSKTYVGLSEVVSASDPNTLTDNLSKAYSCFNSGKYNESTDLFNQVLNNKSNNAKSLSAYAGLVMLDSESSSDPNFSGLSVTDLKAEFAGDLNLPCAVYDVAKYCYNKGLKTKNQSKSVALIKESLPLLEESLSNAKESQQPETYLMIAESYSRLGDHNQALVYYQELLNGYPDYENDWHVYFMMAGCYEKLARSGLITYDQADEQIASIYTYIVQQYPDCKAAPAANNWLALNAL